MTNTWVSGADVPTLRLRARLLRAIREFFFERQVLEVTTPALGAAGVTDVHIVNLSLHLDSGQYFLQTSPEYFMKRLLAGESGPIYQIGPAFRGGESGSRHNTEFTMLEWYRPGFTLVELLAEFEDLLRVLCIVFECDPGVFARHRYKDLFFERWGENPHRADLETLRRIAHPLASGHIADTGDEATRNSYLELLFAEGVEKALTLPSAVLEYPASQAALAEVGEDDEGETVAFRFEFLWNGIELANGYLELRDANQLSRRMSMNNKLREARGLPQVEPDRKLLAALPHMPPCSGVAVGLDRLLMVLTGKQSLDEILAFSDRRL